MKKLLQFILLFLLIIFPSKAFAESKVEVKVQGDDVQTSVNSYEHSTSRTEINTNDSSTISVHQSGGGDNSVKINNDQFEIKGKVTSISNSSFDLSNQKIYLDASEITKLKSSGILVNGNTVTAKGNVKNGNLYATEVQGSAVSNSQTSTPSPSPSDSGQNSPSPSSSSNPDVLGASSEGEIKVEIKNDNFFVKILDFCKGILSSININL